ncbi:MAG: hypothetical protein AAFQ07_05000 [Chloroflexota bacterium]
MADTVADLGNIVVIIGIIVGVGVLVWQFVGNRDVFSDDDSYDDERYWTDDVNEAESRLEETEEFLARMERLSKRDDDEKK